jgi:hypothetical protein
MVTSSFIADVSIPGLGASDLVRHSNNVVVATGYGESNWQRRLRQAVRGFDTRVLRDIGLDRGSL